MAILDSFRIIYGILQDIASSPDGVSTGEIVEQYGIERRSVPNYIATLESVGIPIYVDRKRYYIDKNFSVPFTLTPEENEFLMLALERSLTSHNSRWRVVQNLLNRLKTFGNADRIKLPRIDNLPDQPANTIFILLTQAKSSRLEVIVEYHPLRRDEPTQWRIRPFRFVSNPLSDGFYVLCEGTQDNQNYAKLSLKFDRILRVKITDIRFQISDQARFASQDRQAWGVWHSNQTPVLVKLLFEPKHYDRLLESVWHDTQRVGMNKEGFVTFDVYVSEPDEMIPWIRSWGSGVVVLEPEWLRNRIIRSLQRQIEAYGLGPIASTNTESFSQQAFLWAKYERQSGRYHLLVYHLLDVASVALVMWQQVVSAGQRQWLANLLGLDEESTGRFIAFLAGLHDIGKATPSFQSKAKELYGRFTTQSTLYDVPHGVLSTVILEKLLANGFMSKRNAPVIASVIGGHHGAWVSDSNVSSAKGKIGDVTWQILQKELLDILQKTLHIEPHQCVLGAKSLNIFAMFLSGFISVCDWIGSIDEYFPYETQLISYEQYAIQSQQQASIALNELGWLGWKPTPTRQSFADIFAFSPNSLQESVLGIFTSLEDAPKLILVEYLTGAGKTELALHLADALTTRMGLNGVYIAMPTQATSNQMFERVARYLEARYPNESINVQLAHSQAEHHRLYQPLPASSHREGNESGITAQSWFKGNKRALLAPYAVGTIDQAMLGVLQVKHHFVKQYALSNKVIIFDEIHSYDTYMNTVIDRLLSWLNALNSPMILLSATLSDTNRKNLLARVTDQTQNLPQVDYPRLTVVHQNGSVGVYALPKPETRIISLKFIMPQDESLLEAVLRAYEKGGCIAIVCNTVDEAIHVVRLLENYIEEDELFVFHARFPQPWRASIEEKVLSDFGKNGKRPQRAVLVATQIIEQSLDIDFDLIITSTAPIDLLIQRAGRLHRHQRPRPEHLSTPTLMLRMPGLSNEDVPNFGVDGVIYAEFFLLKTWLCLNGRTSLSTPDEIDALMNFVYSESTTIEGISDSYQKALLKAYDDMAMNSTRSEFRGSQSVIGLPDDEGLVGSFNQELPDDERHHIATREFSPYVDIICIIKDNILSIGKKPNKTEEAYFLQYRVRIQKKAFRETLNKLPDNPAWERVASLQYAKPIEFDEDGIYRLPNSNLVLRLTRRYGLELIIEE